MEQRIQLEDLIPEYPSVDEENFQRKISSRWEFAEMASSADEAPPKKGDFFKHQKLIQRFMLQYNRLMILHETGTGKSFLIGAVGETLRKSYHEGRGIKRVLVLVTGDTQKIDMINLLVCRSTNGEYLTPGIINAATDQAQKTNATRSISKFYTVTTYRRFSKEISQKDDMELRALYSDTLIILDEIHNLRLSPEGFEKVQRNIADNPGNILSEDMDSDLFREKTIKLDNGKKVKKMVKDTIERVYKSMWRLTHVPDRIKVMGLTASLVINEVNEAGPVLNLILPINRQFAPRTRFNDLTLKDIEAHTRGYISYVRALDTGAVEKKEYLLLDDEVTDPDTGEQYISQIVAAPISMSDIQSNAYIEAFEADESVNQGGGLRPKARQASGGIFPDGSYGNPPKGGGESNFKKYVIPEGNWYRATPEFYDILRNEDDLADHNAKAWYTIFEVINKTNGIVVIFNELVKGSGLIYLALALEANGYARFTETTSVFETSTGIAPYCTNQRDSNRNLKPGFTQRNRYAAIISDTPKKQVPVILNTISSYENRYGDYIKVLLISELASEGISINNALAFVQYGGVWNPAQEYQARSRVFRSTSHVDLLNEQIDDLIQSGVPEEEAKRQAKIEVKVYKLMTVFPTEEEAPDLAIPEGVESVDLLMYRYSEAKNRESKKLMRKLKQSAIDCQIHYERNVRPDDVDGTPECDYDECVYECVDPMADDYDYSTYDIIYMNEAIDKIREDIQNYFRFNGMGSLRNIHRYLNPDDDDVKLRSKYIQLALARMIVDREPLIDRFGYQSYIKEDNGLYYLSKTYPLHTQIFQDQTAAYYGKTLIAKKVSPFSEVLGDIEKHVMDVVVAELLALDSNDPKYRDNIIAKISNYNIENHAVVLEDAVERHLKGIDTVYADTIMDIFKGVLFKTNEPIGEIKLEAAELKGKSAAKRSSQVPSASSGSRKRRSRATISSATAASSGSSGSSVAASSSASPTLVNKLTGTSSRSKPKLEEGEEVYFHNIYTHVELDTNYSKMTMITKAAGKLRLLKPSEDVGWRDMLEYETNVYSEIVKGIIAQRLEELEQHGIYGIIDGSGVFRIRHKINEEKTLQESQSGSDKIGHKIHKGRVCSTYEGPDLLDIMWYVEADIASVQNNRRGYPSETVMKNGIAKKLSFSRQELDTWDLERIKYYYYYTHLRNLAKKQQCISIQRALKRQGLIWYAYIEK